MLPALGPTVGVANGWYTDAVPVTTGLSAGRTDPTNGLASVALAVGVAKRWWCQTPTLTTRLPTDHPWTRPASFARLPFGRRDIGLALERRPELWSVP